MKMADILHNIADMLDKQEAPANTEKSADDFQHDVHNGADDGGAGDVEVGKFLPPLQAKLELLKKASGVENEYDSADELDDIKKLTGIKPVVMQISSEDNDITG